MRLSAAPVVAALALAASATSSFGVTPYFDQLRFVEPTAWTVGSPYTTSQLWDNGTPSWFGPVTPTGTGNSLSNSNPAPLATPALTVTGGINETPYLFNGGTALAVVPNYGGVTGAPIGSLTDTIVRVQIAATVGGTGSALNPTGLGEVITPGSLSISANGGTFTPFSTTLLDSRVNAVGFGFTVGSTTFTPNAEQWLYEFRIPNYTGDFSVSWGHQAHAVFEALRVDTALVAVPEPTTAVMTLPALALLARRRRA